MVKLKTPDGILVEEYKTVSSHLFKNGKIIIRDHDSTNGEYTGRFWFEYADGSTTRIYTKRTAPKWLLSFYNKATSG